jgi:putative ABC transport system permease protein
MNLLINFHDVFESLKKNKTRSVLSGFGVFWGVLILIILLGAGKGFQEGVLGLFSSFAKKSIWVYTGQVSENKLDEFTKKKSIFFEYSDLEIVKKRFSEIEFISPELNFKGNSLTKSDENTAYPQIKGVFPDYFNIKTIEPEKGRLLNVLDNNEYKRVALIGTRVEEGLFPSGNSIGNSINIAGTFFKVIGVIEKGSLFTQNEQNSIYVPFSTFKDCLNNFSEFNSIGLTLSGKTNALEFENKFKSFLAKRKGFNASDKKALYIVNLETQVKSFDMLFNGIDTFLWLIGLSFLLSGVLSISNIMLVVVKERTFEIGIRKAIGARPQSIIWMIITESVLITSVAGLLGVFFGIVIIEIINWVISSFFNSKDLLFTSARVNFPIILFALIALVFSGVFAGFLPAKKAASIAPVEALKQES